MQARLDTIQPPKHSCRALVGSGGDLVVSSKDSGALLVLGRLLFGYEEGGDRRRMEFWDDFMGQLLDRKLDGVC